MRALCGQRLGSGGGARPCPFLGNGQWAPSAEFDPFQSHSDGKAGAGDPGTRRSKNAQTEKGNQYPEVRHQRWLADKMVYEPVEAFPEVPPTSCKLALARAIELHRAELRNQQSGRNRRFGRRNPVLGWTIMMIDDDAGATFAHATGPSWRKSESGKGGSASRATIFAPPALRVLMMVPLVVLSGANYERANRSRN